MIPAHPLASGDGASNSDRYKLIEELILEKIRELNEEGHYYPHTFVVCFEDECYCVELEFNSRWRWHIEKVDQVILLFNNKKVVNPWAISQSE